MRIFRTYPGLRALVGSLGLMLLMGVYSAPAAKPDRRRLIMKQLLGRRRLPFGNTLTEADFTAPQGVTHQPSDLQGAENHDE